MKRNILVGQAGGPTAVINASLAGVIGEAQKISGKQKIYGMRFGIEGFLDERLIDLSRLEPAEIERLRRTPGSALGSCRYKLRDEDLPNIRRLLESYEIGTLFYIGGNDTMDSINRIESYCRNTGYELTAIGVPKTVDNDLYGTDHTPGYASAARYVALSIRQGGRLAEDMQKVDTFLIYQTIGRDAGWLAAASALAKKRPSDPPHLIYVPEHPMNRDTFLGDVSDTVESYGWASVVVGEGVVWEDGTPVCASSERDRFSNIEFGAMGGTSAAVGLHRILSDEFGFRGEFQIPESLQMCADDRVSEIDRKEAEAVGIEAVRAAAGGLSGKMIGIERIDDSARDKAYAVRYDSTPLSDVALHTKPLPEEFLTEGFVTQAFIDYCTPLVGDFPHYHAF